VPTLDVEIQMMEIPSVLTNRNSTINKTTSVHEEDIIPKVNKENATSTIKESHATKTPYQHPNHKRSYNNKSFYQHYSERKQLTYLPKNIDAGAIEFHNTRSSWEL
jgi:hypothetical protein